jgi:hypothetical protein
MDKGAKDMNVDRTEGLVKRGRVVTAQVRGLNVDFRRKMQSIKRENYSETYLRETEQRERAAVEAQAAKLVGNLPAELLAAKREPFSRKDAMRSVTRFTSAPAKNDALLSGDAAQRALLADLLELATASHWRETAREMTDNELVEKFAAELPRQHFAICNTLMREADKRAGHAPEGASGMDARTLPRLLDKALDQSNLFDGAEKLYRDLRLVDSYLSDSLAVVGSGEPDKGIRNELIFKLRDEGATNDQINEAVSALNNAAA